MNEKELTKIIKLLFDVKMINYDLEKVCGNILRNLSIINIKFFYGMFVVLKVRL